MVSLYFGIKHLRAFQFQPLTVTECVGFTCRPFHLQRATFGAASPFWVSICQVHADKSQEINSSYLETVEHAVSQFTDDGPLLVMGDFNAHLGNQQQVPNRHVIIEDDSGSVLLTLIHCIIFFLSQLDLLSHIPQEIVLPLLIMCSGMMMLSEGFPLV